MAEGDFPKSDGDVLYASEVNRMNSARIEQVYTGSQIDSNQTSAGTDTGSIVLDPVYDTYGGSYAIFDVTCFPQANGTSSSNVKVEIFTAESGTTPSYSETLDLQIAQCTYDNDVESNMTDKAGKTIHWVHTLTANERTNGFHSYVKSTSTNASTSFTNKQIVLSLG